MIKLHQILKTPKGAKPDLLRVENGRSYGWAKDDVCLSWETKADDGYYDIKFERKAQNITLKTKVDTTTPAIRLIEISPLAETITFDPKDLAFVAKAVSTEEIRYYLNGIFIDTERQKMAATDGHRLHIKSTVIPANMEPMIIPRGLITLMLKFKVYQLNVANSPMDNFRGGLKQLSFVHENITFYMDTIDGTYPDYNRAIHTDNRTKITVNSDGLPDLKKCCIAIAEDGRASLYTNEAKDIIIWLYGDPIETPAICFNYDYFQVYGKNPSLLIGEPHEPAIINGDGMLMPFRF